MVQRGLRGQVKERTPRPGSETASWVMLGASLTIIPWLVCYALAKLIQAGIV